MSSERRMAAAALLISVFVAGSLCGAAVMQFINVRAGGEGALWERPFPRGPVGMRPMMGIPDSFGAVDSLGMPKELWPMRMNERLAQRLDLTPEQHDAIQEILERGRTEASEVLDEIYPRLRASLDSVGEEIRTILTEEQAELFERFLGEGRGMFMRGRDGRGPGPPGMMQRFP